MAFEVGRLRRHVPRLIRTTSSAASVPLAAALFPCKLPRMPDVFRVAGDAWLRQALGGFGPLLALGAVLFFVQRWTQSNLAKVIGWGGVVYWTGWIGTPIHEASHVVVGKLFGIRLLEVRLFSPDRESGVLGYVRYQTPQWSEVRQVVGTFMMGIAPLFGGAVALWVVRILTIEPAADAPFVSAAGAFATALPGGDYDILTQSFGELLYRCYEPIYARGAADPWIWLYLYVSLAIGTHLAPSGADLRGGLRGLLFVALLAYVVNLGVAISGADPRLGTSYLAQVTGPMATLLALALALNVGHGVAAFALATVRRIFP